MKSLKPVLTCLVYFLVKSEQMHDGQWMQGQEPETFRFGFNNMDHPNFAGPLENYASPPSIERHATNFDYQMRPDLPPPPVKNLKI